MMQKVATDTEIIITWSCPLKIRLMIYETTSMPSEEEIYFAFVSSLWK